VAVRHGHPVVLIGQQSRPGDLAGSVGPVKPGAKNRKIKIDTVVKQVWSL
jgi:hypothetical protein